jgi:hypothetical protein
LTSRAIVDSFSTGLSIDKSNSVVQPKVVICDESVSCTHQFINGQKFKILTTDDVVVIVSLGMGERYMRADVSVFNHSLVAVDVLAAYMRLEVITPKERHSQKSLLNRLPSRWVIGLHGRTRSTAWAARWRVSKRRRKPRHRELSTVLEQSKPQVLMERKQTAPAMETELTTATAHRQLLP